jgi:tripartite-type tricarboxylate transporter receptor subunit TctC
MFRLSDFARAFVSRRIAAFAISLTALTGLAAVARAQAAYPDHPVRILVPFGPGGVADITARLVAEKLSEKLVQNFVIETMPGPGGIAAARAVMQSPADGYTLAFFTNGTAISVPLFSHLPIVDKLNAALRAVLADPELKKRALDLGIDAEASTPGEVDARMKSDIEKWTKVIEEAHILRQ